MNTLYRIDAYLLLRVFMPLAHWIDRKFHINPWKVAAKILIFATVMFFIHMLMPPILYHWVLAVITPALLFIRWFELTRLERISDAYERRPDLLPAEYLKLLSDTFLRMWFLLFGLLFFTPHDIVSAISDAKDNYWLFPLYFIPRSWFLMTGIAYYFQSVPPPPGKRDEKKAEAPMFGKLAGVES